MPDPQSQSTDVFETQVANTSEDQATAAYAAPAILTLGDVNTETLQTGIPG